MGSNQLPQDGVCYHFTFVPHTPKFSKQMTESGIELLCIAIHVQCR